MRVKDVQKVLREEEEAAAAAAAVTAASHERVLKDDEWNRLLPTPPRTD